MSAKKHTKGQEAQEETLRSSFVGEVHVRPQGDSVWRPQYSGKDRQRVRRRTGSSRSPLGLLVERENGDVTLEEDRRFIEFPEDSRRSRVRLLRSCSCRSPPEGKPGSPRRRSRMFTAAFVLVVAAGSKPTSSGR